MPTLQYSQEEMWKIYEKLPKELQDAVFSAENADHTFSVCERHNINECSKVASQVGLVLMGLLLPEEFEKALVKEVQLKKATAQQAARDINRFIFYPVKIELEQLHKIETGKAQEGKGANKPQEAEEQVVFEEETISEEIGASTMAPKKQPKKSGEADPYREPIE